MRRSPPPLAATPLALGLLLLLAAGCKSSAPYTIPAAAINSAIAVGASAAQRSAGGCYAQCVAGTVCNPRTGFCEQPTAVCLGQPSDPPSCLTRPGASMGAAAELPGSSGQPGSPIGVSPATGSVPPPPSSASPTPSITRP
ncbi:MAG TPA: hypothetical protein PLL32_10555 [Anaeromyxobacteraceae bacterium]|nr:hypothetical protein [Anaeromyxobacteraceae bacterium]